MALPLKYNLRNVVVRWRATVSTVLGIALVVAVFVLLQALARGIEASSANTGDPRNVLVVRRGSQAESGSLVSREHFQTLRYFDEVAQNERGEPIISAEVVIIVSAPRVDGSGEANVLVRGVTPRGMELRPQVSLVEGRWFQRGQRETVVSRRLAARFAGLQVGGSIKAGQETLKVVGHFDGNRSAFDSEAWMDADEARSVFDRESYSSILLRPKDAAAYKSLTNRIESDKRLSLRAEPEVDYYSKQTMTAAPIKILASILGVAMSVGAIFAAMNTMYASVASRTREIGTLRVLGFGRGAVMLCFLIEGAFVASIGGVLGCLLAIPMNGYSTGTIDFQSFAETVFEFRVTPGLMGQGIAFSALLGLLGSLLPAYRASKLPVIAALKSL
jgi:putative ABC transport system permease protein